MKPTFQQCEEVGNRFKKLNSELVSLYADAAKLHGKKEVEGVRLAIKHLGTARSNLDERVFRDYGEKTTSELVNVFYGRG